VSMRVKCDDRSECPATADAVESDRGRFAVEEIRDVMAAVAPRGWTSNNGLGGRWRHFCPLHEQAEIAGG
jgi:hypothetical protein